MASSVSHAASPQASLWQQHHGLFKQLYEVERKTLSQVKRIMESQHEFPETPQSTYETKLRDELGLRKKLKARDWIAVQQHITARGNRPSKVYFRGVAIPDIKVKKEVARNLRKQVRSQASPIYWNLPLPPDVSIVTPPQSPRIIPLRDSAPTPALHPGLEQSLNEPSLTGHNSCIMGSSPQVSVDLGSVSGADCRNLSIAPRFQYHAIFNETKEILASRNASLPSMSFNAAIFDKSFRDLWPPLSDKLPILQTQSSLRGFLTNTETISLTLLSSPAIHRSGHQCMMTQEELELTDAVELGLSSAMALNAESPLGFEDMSYGRSDSQISTNIDPLYALSVVMYHLANHLTVSDKIFDLLYWLVQQIPWSLLEAFLRLDSPIVRESWGRLLDWSLIFGETFFESLTSILIEDSHWIKWRGARVLIITAWYDCHEICTLLIRLGIPPNQACSFPASECSKYEEFSKFDNLETAQSYGPYRYKGMYLLSSPLIEAAVKGNINSVCALLVGGADVNLRCEGYTAAGYLLYALKRDNLDRDRGYAVMQLLLENGADVNEPIQENPRFSGLGYADGDRPDYSVETLLDEAYLTNDSDLIRLLQRFDATPTGLLTIAGIVSNAEKGIQELQAYLRIASFPRGLPRRRMQEISLHRCFGRPKAFSTMLQVGFDLRLPHLSRIDLKVLGLSYERSFQDAKSIRLITISAFEHTHLTSFSKDIMSLIMRKETAMKAGLIEACLNTGRRDDLLHLLDSGLDVTGQDGVVLMAEAARQDNFEAVVLLLRNGTDINGVVRTEQYDCSVLLLAATWMRVDNELGLLQGHRNLSASIDMLRFLMQQGADVNTCHPILRSNSDRRSLNCIYKDSLQWLIDHGLDLTGESVCNIMMRRLGGSGSLGILQFLIHRNIPIFSPDEPLVDHKNFTTRMHPLSFFILLVPDLEFIYQVLETGIDVNGTGQNVKTDTPLGAAAQIDNLTLVKELICRGALVNDTECGSKYTPLQLACGALDCRNDSFDEGLCPARFDVASYLLEKGADPNATGSKRGETPLRLALMSPNPNIQLIELLLESRADVNELTWGHRSILQVALSETSHLGMHKQHVVEMLIDNGAEVNARWTGDPERLSASAIEETCRLDNPDCINLVELLLDRGAELNPPIDYIGSTVLDIACICRNIDLIKLLLDRGMDPNPKMSYRCGPLAVAAAKGDLVIAILLLAAGAKVSVGSGFCVECCFWECCPLPLVAAAMNGRLDMVALLLDLETREDVFERAISSARENGYLAIASYIQHHIDRNNSPPQMQAEELC